MVAEQIHRYPRWITWALDLLSFLAVGAALLLFSRDLMTLLWKSYGIDTTLMARVPYLPEIVQAITQGAPLPRQEVVGSAGTFNLVFGLHLLLPALGWLALALLLLSPGSFFSRRTKAEVAAAPPQVMMNVGGREVLRGTYPRRIGVIFVWVSGLLALVLLVRYAVYWLKFLALTFPVLQNQPLF